MVWKRSHGSSNIHRIKTSFRHFSNYKIPIHIKYSPIHAIKLWKLLVAVVVISLTIHSVNEQNRRIQPQRNIDYSLLSQADTFDEKFTDRLLKKCPISHRSFKSNVDDVFQYGCRDPLKEAEKPRANAAFVVLARNSEIDGVILSMRSLERRFNQWFNYPWVFLNDEEFTEEFKTRVEEVASGDFKFGVIPKSKWKFEQQQESESSSRFFNEVVENQGDRGIMYGNMPSYHSMCRFYSGFFFEHPLVQSLDWYWRVEPEVDFYCDLTYDPFIEMEKHGKKYGYTIAIKELIDTVPNLFRYTKQFILENNIELPDTWNFFSTNYKFFKGKNSNDYSDVKNLNDFWAKLKKNTLFNYSKLHLLNNAPLKLNKRDKEFLQNLVKHSKPYGLNSSVNEKYDNENFNMCHFWSNFEIASNELFTSPAYKAYYEFLEKSNGFFTERWGDAPIHSLAAGMFLTLDEIHYFRDIGYKHSTIGHCPFNSPNQLPYKAGPKFKHQVLPEDEIYYADYDKPVTDDVLSQNLGASGCRCRCPSDHIEIENSGGSCSALWLKLTDDEYNNAKSNNDDNNNSNNRSQKGKNKNNKDAGSDVFVGGLGDFNFLDLDKIEPLALQYLQEWIDSGKNLKDWDLTDDQIKVLSILYRKDEISLID